MKRKAVLLPVSGLGAVFAISLLYSSASFAMNLGTVQPGAAALSAYQIA
ncbi:MAG: hypothetical protein ABW092_19750 [Candidatus Thiodiazotropha sp.]